MKNKKTKISIIVILAIIILAVAGYIGYQVAERAKQETLLAAEASKLSNLNIATDEIDMEIKTKDKFATVESAMKTCLKDYQDSCKDVENFNEESEISKMLDVSTYQSDAPEFANTKKALSDYKTGLNEKINNLINRTSKESIMEYIQKENLDTYYNNLYEKLMFDEDTIKTLESEKESMEKVKNALNDMIDAMQDVFNYLSEHKDKWTIQNRTFYFYDNTSLSEYNDLISKLQEKMQAVQNF